MSEIIMEPIAEDNENAVSLVKETATDLPQALPAEDVPVPVSMLAAPKRKPGRPKGSANKAKAAPPAPPPAPKPRAKRVPPKLKANPSSDNDDSSSSEEDKRIFNNLMQDDMETQILQFLTARKKDQSQKRHTLWTNLASSGLR